MAYSITTVPPRVLTEVPRPSFRFTDDATVVMATRSAEPRYADPATERISGGDGVFGAMSAVTIDTDATDRKVTTLTDFNSSHGQGTISARTTMTIDNVNLTPDFGIRLVEDGTTPYCWVNTSGYPWADALGPPALEGVYTYASGSETYVNTGVGHMEYSTISAPHIAWTLLDNGQAGSGAAYPIDYFNDTRTNPSGTMRNGVKSQRYDGRISYVTTVSAGNKMRGTGWEIADLVPTNWTYMQGVSDYDSLVDGDGLAKLANVSGPQIKYTFASALPAGTYSIDITRTDSSSSTATVAVGEAVTWSGGTFDGSTRNDNTISRTDTVSFTNSTAVTYIELYLPTTGPVVTQISVVG